VSDDDPHCGDIDDRSVRAFAVKPAPSARRDAALGLTARRDRANPATVPLMHSLRCSGNHGTRLSDNVRQVECWFSQTMADAPVASVPGPVVGAGLPGLMAFAMLLLVRYRKRRFA